MDAKQAEVEQGIYRRTGSHFLAGRVVCENCGSPYRRITFGKKGKRKTIWKCRDRHYGKNGSGCKNVILDEKVLFEKLNNILGLREDLTEADCENVRRVIVGKDGDITVEHKALD